MAKRKRRAKAQIQGRKLVGKRKITPMKGGLFTYKGDIYDIDCFPPRATVNLDKTSIPPICKHKGELKPGGKNNKGGKKKKKQKKDYKALLFSNLEDCPDALEILEEIPQAAC